MQEIRGYCPLCISRCGSISRVDAGRLVEVRPDPQHPTGGSFCIKGRAAPELVHSERRLLYPLMRSRPKGDPNPGWQRVSWDAALDYAAERMRIAAEVHGPESVVFGVTTPSGTAVADAFAWIHRLAHAFGSPNVLFATENCNWHKDHATALTFGSPIGTPDFERTGCMLLWGFNPATSWPAYARAATAARRRGARLIVVAPRRAGLAASADQWLPVRPGTDAALALAIAGVMIEEGWYDEGFLTAWSNGPLLVRDDNGRFLRERTREAAGSQPCLLAWDAERGCTVAFDPTTGAYLGEPAQRLALRGAFVLHDGAGPVRCRPAFEHFAARCAEYPPERAAELTGVPAAQIRATAELLHHARPVSYYHWAGVCQQGQATQAGRAIGLLYALTGSFDAPGGNVRFATPPLNDVLGFDLLSATQLAKALGSEERPLGPPSKGWVTSRDFAQAALRSRPYPVRGLLSFGANPLLTKPHTPQLEPALKGLDFFVHADMFENPSARYADLLLPVASPWERGGLAPGFQLGQAGSAWLQLRQPVLEPLGESRSDTAIVFALAQRLGLGADFFHGDQRGGLRHVLAPSGVSLEDLEAEPGGIRVTGGGAVSGYREQGLATPTRRLEVYCERLLEAGDAPVPDYRAGVQDAGAAYPLHLTSAKWPHFCHSQHHALPSLRAKNPEPLVELHPQLAARHGIGDGNWVLIRSPIARMRARARLTEAIASDTVCAQYGWWESAPGLGLPGYGLAEANFNALIDDEGYDRASGSNPLKGYPCAIEPATAGPGGET